MNLGNRLQTIAQKIPADASVADIGTDHGYLPVYLIKAGIAKKAIACDLSQGSLMKAKEIVIRENLSDSIETRQGNGLTVIQPGEVDTVVIAGMGGQLIGNILQESPEVTNNVDVFILQPMTGQEMLRRWLLAHGFTIVDESLAKEDNRFYEIIVARHGSQTVTRDVYYEIGEKLIEKRDPLLEEFIMHKVKCTQELMSKLKKTSTAGSEARLLELEDKLRDYKEVYLWSVK